MNVRRALSLCLPVVLAVASLSRAGVQPGDRPALRFTAFGTHDTVDLANLHGKIVVVDFWATWCGPCMAEAGHMVAVNQQYHDKGLQFIGISLDSDPSALPPVIKAKNFTWPMSYEGLGWSGATPKAWGVEAIPETFIIGPDGAVLWRGNPGEIDAPLADAFAKHPPQLVSPQVLSAAKQALASADAAAADGQWAKATKLLATIPAETRLDLEFTAALATMTDKVQAAGTKALADADALVAQQQYTPATAKLREAAQTFAIVPAGVIAKQKLADLMRDPAAKAAFAADRTNKAANDALATATSLKAAKKDELAYPRFKQVVASYPGTPAATTAAEAVKAYEADHALMARINAKANGQKAQAALSMAETYKSSGNLEQARAKYQQVIDAFPGTPWAETAKRGIAALSGM